MTNEVRESFRALGKGELQGSSSQRHRMTTWYKRLDKVINTHERGEWVSVLEGPITALRVYRSMFRRGDMNMPDDAVFDADVVRDHPRLGWEEGMLVFRFCGWKDEFPEGDVYLLEGNQRSMWTFVDGVEPYVVELPEDEDPFWILFNEEAFYKYVTSMFPYGEQSMYVEIERYCARHEIVFDYERAGIPDPNRKSPDEEAVASVPARESDSEAGAAVPPTEETRRHESGSGEADSRPGESDPAAGEQAALVEGELDADVPAPDSEPAPEEGGAQASAPEEEAGQAVHQAGEDIGQSIEDAPEVDRVVEQDQPVEPEPECWGAPIGSTRKHDWWSPLQGAPRVCRWCDSEEPNSAEVQSVVSPGPAPAVAQPEGRSIAEIIAASKQPETPTTDEPIPGLEDFYE